MKWLYTSGLPRPAVQTMKSQSESVQTSNNLFLLSKQKDGIKSYTELNYNVLSQHSTKHFHSGPTASLCLVSISQTDAVQHLALQPVFQKLVQTWSFLLVTSNNQFLVAASDSDSTCPFHSTLCFLMLCQVARKASHFTNCLKASLSQINVTTARRYANAVYAVIMCLSVCLLQVGVLQR